MVRDAIREGDRLPIDKGAAPRVLRAFSGDAGERLDRVRNDGLCISYGEFDAELGAVSIPVFGANRQIVGALTLSGPRYRFSQEQVRAMVPPLREGARSLTASFGGDPEWITAAGAGL
jgi:DNA-binding IclR family transcriptional regulator